MQIQKYAALKKNVFPKLQDKFRNIKPAYKAIHNSQMFHKRGFIYTHMFILTVTQKWPSHREWVSSALKHMQMKSVL